MEPTLAESIRGASTLSLLQQFFGKRAAALLASCGGSVLRLFNASPAGNSRGYRHLLAAQELLRRVGLESIRDAPLTNPAAVREYLTLHFATQEAETFVALWLDAQHRLMQVETLFTGTLTQTSVYPREVVRSALRYNAAAVILAHQHPSGVSEPSRADELLTANLKQALSLVDVRLIDHFVVAGHAVLSFTERGLL
jgi:DNA repair protein RadC